jgi:cold-inducible RNA-binding protein
MNIFIGNLDYGLDEIEVIKLFALYGDVSTIKLIRDRDTGQSKGYAFIEMPKEAEALRAIDHVNGREINGKKLVVHEAKPPEEYNKEKEAKMQQRPPMRKPGSRPPYRGGNPERRDSRDQRPPYPPRERRDYPSGQEGRKDYPPSQGYRKDYPSGDYNRNRQTPPGDDKRNDGGNGQ